MFRVELTEFKPCETQILEIRFKVFVEEQGVDPQLEVDGRDSQCLHAIAYRGDTPIGTGRLLPDGHIGRLAVLKAHRSQGVGRKILLKLIEAARERSWSRVELSSQVQAISFYEKFGFERFGDTYLDAGIVHTDMALDLKGFQSSD